MVTKQEDTTAGGVDAPGGALLDTALEVSRAGPGKAVAVATRLFRLCLGQSPPAQVPHPSLTSIRSPSPFLAPPSSSALALLFQDGRNFGLLGRGGLGDWASQFNGLCLLGSVSPGSLK